jgi:hypothetical protein
LGVGGKRHGGDDSQSMGLGEEKDLTRRTRRSEHSERGEALE